MEHGAEQGFHTIPAAQARGSRCLRAATPAAAAGWVGPFLPCFHASAPLRRLLFILGRAAPGLLQAPPLMSGLRRGYFAKFFLFW